MFPAEGLFYNTNSNPTLSGWLSFFGPAAHAASYFFTNGLISSDSELELEQRTKFGNRRSVL